MILEANLSAAASSTIPLAPDDEDLRLPQRPVLPPSEVPSQSRPSAPTAVTQNTAPSRPSTASSAAQTPPLPPTPAAREAANREEELSRREFEINRRERDLKTREEALRSLETDVESKIRAGELTKNELNSLIARNQAILDEQKTLKEQQQKEEDVRKAASVEHLVAAFKTMKPEEAGLLISSMDDSVAVSILSAMPGPNAGRILANVTPDKAARLVKSLSQNKLDPMAILDAQPQTSGQLPAN
jgi:flagellar motility protein MotE (MotC chaperone)